MKLKNIFVLSLVVVTLSSCSLLGGTNNNDDSNKEEVEKVKYTVSFYNDDKVTLLYEAKVNEGEDAIYNGTTPTKVSTDPSKYYTFSGWDKALTNILSDTSFYATYKETIYEYKCTFNNYDNSLLYETYVEYGKDVTYIGETPTKLGEEGEIYTFTGWDKALTSIKEDTVFTAEFSKQKEEYDVKFLNYDLTELYKTTVKHGSDVTYLGETPTKPKTEEFNYTFKGWDKPLTNIVSDTKFIAQYTEATNVYTCNFYNGDNSLLKSYSVKYNENVVYDGATPTKVSEGHNYTFKEWDKSLNNIKEDTNFYPTFNDVLDTYTVNFYSDDTKTTLLYTATDVTYGTEAVYAGETPTKTSDEYFSYTFSGWSEDITSITKNTDVYAEFSKTRIKESKTVTTPTSTTMGYTLVEPISGNPYKEDFTYTPLKDSSSYAYDYLGTLSDKDVYQGYYCQIWEKVAQLDASSKNITTTASVGGQTYYTFGSVKYKLFNSFNYTTSFLMGVLEMFRNDNPREYYVMGNILYSSTSVNFVISDEYLSASSRSTAFTTIDTYVSSVESLLSIGTEEVKARGIYDKIISDTTYVDSSDESEHNVLGIASNTGAVCEGYSLMYALCAYRLNLDAIWYVGIGTAGGSSGGHAWNAVKIGGTYYWLDATWGDTTNSPNSYYKVKDSAFSQEHTIATASNDNFDYLPAPSPLY